MEHREVSARKYEDDLQTLRAQMDQLTHLVLSMMTDSLTALEAQNLKAAQSVIGRHAEVKMLDTDVNQLCIKILALYDPKADLLRFVTTALNITRELGRIAETLVEISTELHKIKNINPSEAYPNLKKMGKEVDEMIRLSLEAFCTKDSSRSIAIIERDNIVDKLHNKAINKSVKHLESHKYKAVEIVSIIHIVRSYERIADHAAAIAEMVYYMTTGKLIKHAFVLESHHEQDSSSQ